MRASQSLRLGMLGIVAVSLFAALIGRLWYLQVLAAPEYQQAAERNQVRLIPIPAPRGRILDRNGDVVVENRISTIVTVDKTALGSDDRPALVARLAALLGEQTATIERRLDDPRHNPVLPVSVADDVDESVVVAIRERPDLFDPEVVSATQVAVRGYPHGALAAHLLGYVGEINDREMEARDDGDYRLGDEIGKSGAELVFEDDLRGVAGVDKLEVDAQGRVLRRLGRREPVPGHDVMLSIDLGLQRAAEQALREGLVETRTRRDRQTGRRYEAPAGSAVVLDPSNGQVLAMASYPSFDPSEFVGGISVDLFERLQDPVNHAPLNNRVIQGEYAPGSTFKLVTAAAALTAGLITPDTTIVDGGSLRVGNRTFRNAGSTAYGRIALARAITVSSDVFFYRIGRDAWQDRVGDEEIIQDAAEAFGMGSETGIPLPFEADGRVPGPETRAALHEADPEAFPEGRWFTGDNVNLAIGQGEMVATPLQLANAYAAFANGGILRVPELLVRTQTADGNPVRTPEPAELGRIEMAPRDWEAIMTGLEGVTVQDRGTATARFTGFDQSAFRVAGKTGTAQVFGKHDTALFVAVAPSRAPRYAVAVVMEESGFGSTAASPVARRILEVASGQAEPPPAGPVPATPLVGAVAPADDATAGAA